MFYAAMSRKTEVAYTAVFNHIRQVIPFNGLQVVMADFEDPLRSAIQECFPEAQCAGCLFHYYRVRAQ